MRALELAKVAAAAEGLRLRRLARRQAIRAALAIAALLFGLAAFAFLHTLAFVALEGTMQPWLAALIVLVIDAVIAGTLATLALNKEPDRIEREAATVRHEALAGAKRAVNVLSVGAEVAGFAMRRGTRQVLRGARVGRWMTMFDIATRFLHRR